MRVEVGDDVVLVDEPNASHHRAVFVDGDPPTQIGFVVRYGDRWHAVPADNALTFSHEESIEKAASTLYHYGRGRFFQR